MDRRARLWPLLRPMAQLARMPAIVGSAWHSCLAYLESCVRDMLDGGFRCGSTTFAPDIGDARAVKSRSTSCGLMQNSGRKRARNRSLARAAPCNAIVLVTLTGPVAWSRAEYSVCGHPACLQCDYRPGTRLDYSNATHASPYMCAVGRYTTRRLAGWLAGLLADWQLVG